MELDEDKDRDAAIKEAKEMVSGMFRGRTNIDTNSECICARPYDCCHRLNNSERKWVASKQNQLGYVRPQMGMTTEMDRASIALSLECSESSSQLLMLYWGISSLTS